MKTALSLCFALFLTTGCAVNHYGYNVNIFDKNRSKIKVEVEERLLMLPVLFHITAPRKKCHEIFIKNLTKNKYPVIFSQDSYFPFNPKVSRKLNELLHKGKWKVQDSKLEFIKEIKELLDKPDMRKKQGNKVVRYIIYFHITPYKSGLFSQNWLIFGGVWDIRENVLLKGFEKEISAPEDKLAFAEKCVEIFVENIFKKSPGIHIKSVK